MNALKKFGVFMAAFAVIIAGWCISTPVNVRAESEYTIALSGTLSDGPGYRVDHTSRTLILTESSSSYVVSGSTDYTVQIGTDGITLMLAGVDIDPISNDAHGIDLNGFSARIYTQENTVNSVKASSAGSGFISAGAGIRVPDGSVLVLDGAGILNVLHEYGPQIGGAAIGSGMGETSNGMIQINGGTINSNGSYGGAAIGSGQGGASIGAITINGGIVNAKTYFGAAIGSGFDGSSVGEITINGGTITALSDFDRAIGKGYQSTSNTITINGGSIWDGADGNLIYPAPVNAQGEPLYFHGLTVGHKALNQVSIDEVVVDLNRTYYGVHDVKTNPDGMVYFFLPKSGSSRSDVSMVGVIVGSVGYRADYHRGEAASRQSLTQTTLYQVAFDANGGNVKLPTPAYVFKGESITTISFDLISSGGNSMLGWNTKQDGSGIMYGSEEPVVINETVTFYAQWSPATKPVNPNPVPPVPETDEEGPRLPESGQNDAALPDAGLQNNAIGMLLTVSGLGVMVFSKKKRNGH